MVPSLPLAPDEVTALLAPLALGPARTLALAVSGGPDSSALAWSLAQHVGPERADLLALIVDHGLRPESAAEADVTLQRLHALGLQGVVLRWTPPPPPRQRLHERARAARYALLLEACRANGRTSLLLAHHRDDQAETVLLRLAKGSGLHGLGGMAPVSTRAGVRLLRPFLSVPKSRLIATCRAAGLPFAEDPSNLSESYARGRLRRVMPLLEVEGLSPERLTDLAERAREDSEALDALMLTFLRANTTFDRTSGTLRLDALAWESCPRALRLRALAACLRAIHPAPFAPRRAGLCALEVALCCATAPDDPWRGARALVIPSQAGIPFCRNTNLGRLSCAPSWGNDSLSSGARRRVQGPLRLPTLPRPRALCVG